MNRYAFASRADVWLSDWAIHAGRYADISDALAAGALWRANMARHGFRVFIQVGEVVTADGRRAFRAIEAPAEGATA